MSNRYNLRTRARAASLPSSTLPRDESSRLSQLTPIGSMTPREHQFGGSASTTPRLYSEVVRRASSPSVAKDLGYLSENPAGERKTAESELLMPSAESDGDDRLWTTVQRKSRHGGQKENERSRNQLSAEQKKTVRAAERQLSKTERDMLNKRNKTVCTRNAPQRVDADSQDAGPSKGKAVDPTNWGTLDLSDSEVDIEAQRAALKSWEAAQLLSKQMNENSS